MLGFLECAYNCRLPVKEFIYRFYEVLHCASTPICGVRLWEERMRKCVGQNVLDMEVAFEFER